MHAINAQAPFILTRALTPALRRARGCVINMVDIAVDRVLPGYAHYTTSKAALLALTKVLAVELAPEVRVNGIAPGIVAYPDAWDEATRERMTERIPLKRGGEPEDVARAALFLAAQPYVTGQILAVDGGWSVHL
jgi:pteridine reductase